MMASYLNLCWDCVHIHVANSILQTRKCVFECPCLAWGGGGGGGGTSMAAREFFFPSGFKNMIKAV